MATNKQQFLNIIEVFENNKRQSNEEIVEAMHDAEPRIKIQTLTVYRSNIDNYVNYGTFASSMGDQFKLALREYYGEDSEEIRDANLMRAITERNEAITRAKYLQQKLDAINNILSRSSNVAS